MLHTKRFLYISLLFGALFPVSLSAENHALEHVFSRGPSPEWIKPFDVDPYEALENARDAGSIYTVLSESQYDIESGTSYKRYIKALRTGSGVQKGSQISISLDPSYQTLTFHQLTIHREGKSIDLLADQEFKILQSVVDHEQQLYDSEVNVLAVLEGIHVGDTIEYSFSIEGPNPVLGAHRGMSFSTNFGKPIRHLRLAYRKPFETDVFEKQYVTDLPRQKSEHDGYETIWWQADELAPVIKEPNLPMGYSPWGRIDLSTFEHWQSVAKWATRQYQLPEVLPQGLADQITKISSLPIGEPQILAATRFVQDEIRYLSISNGVHSMRPHSPETIFQCRFGDCKDKTLILVLMLRTLGYDASPALVKSDFRHAIADWLPSSAAFDHVVVRLILEGDVIWIDPTLAHQRGKLRDFYFPDFGKALVVAEETTQLIDIEPQGLEHSKELIEETFTIPDYTGPATLTVKSRYEGLRANYMRGLFLDTPRTTIEKNHFNFYANSYSELESTAPLKIEDDQINNIFIVWKSYRIRELWKKSSKPNTWHASFSPQDTYNKIKSPGRRKRTMPFAINHPVNVEQRITIIGPDNQIKSYAPPPVTIENPAFRFHFNEESEGTAIKLTFQYQSRKQQVSVDDIPSYLEDIKLAGKNTAYQVWVPSSARTGPHQPSGILTTIRNLIEDWVNWAILSLLALGVITGWLAAFLFPRWKRTVNQQRPFDPQLVGIRGWLILPALEVTATPIIWIYNAIALLANTRPESWQAMVHPKGEYFHWLWEPAWIFDTISTGLLIPFWILALIMFFKHHTQFPCLWIFLLLINTLVSTISTILFLPTIGDSKLTDSTFAPIILSIIRATIWVPYMLRSVRVASTFRKSYESLNDMYSPNSPNSDKPIPTRHTASKK